MIDLQVWVERLQGLREMVGVSELREASQSRTDLVLSNLIEFSGLPDSFLNDNIGFGPAVADSIDSDLDRLPQLLREGSDAEVLSWVRSVNGRLERALEYTVEHIRRDEDPLTYEVLSTHLANIRAEDQLLARLADTNYFLQKAESAATAAESAATVAREAAGMVGDANMALHFEKYARREWWSANIFRVAAIILIVCAVAAAAFLPHAAEGDWVGFGYRVAQIAGIAGLGAYFGRQAGQHRRIYNWARSIQVQLQSFPAFIEPVADEAVRGRIYDVFARRVLGSPPEKGVVEMESSPVPAQMMELMTAVVKRADRA